MFDLGAAVGKLILDTNKWDANIKRAKEDSKSLSGYLMTNEAQVRKLGLAMTAVGASILFASNKMANMAAATVESENLFDVSMGKMQQSARNWSNEFSKSLGLNQFDIRKTLGTLNVMVKSMGISEDAAYEMSKGMTKLSLDMASFYNLSQEDAFGKIQSGLVGMSRPLQNLGIIVNETTTQQWALNNGLIKQGQEMTEAQKVMARYFTILEATQAAQGDLARTMDSSENISRRLGFATSQLSVLLGKTLLPALDTARLFFLKIVTAMSNFTQNHSAVAGAIMVSVAAFGLLAAVAGPLLIILPSVAASFAALGISASSVLVPVTLIILGIAAASGAVYLAFTKWGYIKAIFFSLSEGVNYALSRIQNAIAALFKKAAELSPVMKEQFEGLALSFQASAAGFAKDADMMGQAAADALAEQQAKQDDFATSSQKAADDVAMTFEQMWEKVAGKMAASTDKMKGTLEGFVQKVQQEFNLAEEVGRRTFNAMSDGFSNLFFNVITGELNSLQDIFAEFGRSVLKMLADILAQMMVMRIFGSIFGTAATAGVGGYGAGTPAGAVNMGSWTKLPTMATGTDFVPYTGYYKLHQGEEVKPSKYTDEGKAPIQLTINNLITPEAVAASMSGQEGEGVVMNVINRNSLNRGTIKEVIRRR